MKNSRKIIKLGVSLLIVMMKATLFVSCSSSGVDTKFTKLIDEHYEEINAELIAKFDFLKNNFDEENFQTGGFEVDFSLPKEKVTKREITQLYEGYYRNIIENVFITPDILIVYQLKMCTNEDCRPEKENGSYHHYLSKGTIDFVHEKWVKVVETKKIGEWTYSIVRTSKN